jgi:hypothetical protein
VAMTTVRAAIVAGGSRAPTKTTIAISMAAGWSDTAHVGNTRQRSSATASNATMTRSEKTPRQTFASAATSDSSLSRTQARDWRCHVRPALNCLLAFIAVIGRSSAFRNGDLAAIG